MSRIKMGDTVKANTPYKWVPFIQCKVQLVTVMLIDEDHLGLFFTGKTSKGKIVHFRLADIETN